MSRKLLGMGAVCVIVHKMEAKTNACGVELHVRPPSAPHVPPGPAPVAPTAADTQTETKYPVETSTNACR